MLEQFNGGSLDFRIGVTTTSFPTMLFGHDIGDVEEGMLLKTSTWSTPGSSAPMRTWSRRSRSLPPWAPRAQAKSSRCSRRRLAVTNRIQDGTSGFVRENALLAIVMLTDEDDGSAPPSPIPFVTFGDPYP